jgi:hypothetical protein
VIARLVLKGEYVLISEVFLAQIIFLVQLDISALKLEL